MAEFKVIYFGLYARAEAIRMCLAHSKANWENEITTGEDWQKRKASGEFPNGQIPVLVYKGKYMNESLAILRFVGKKTGMYPIDDEEAWACDAIVDYVNDFLPKFAPAQLFKKDFSEEAQVEFEANIEKLVSFLSKKLEAHGQNFMVGDKVTIADCQVSMAIFSFIFNKTLPGGPAFTDRAQAVVAKHPAFAAYCDRMKSELADHLASRFEASL